MNRIALYVALSLAVALSVAMWRNSTLSSDNARLSSSVAAYEADRERQEEAAAVHRAHIARLQEQGRENAERLRQIEALEGGDAPLSPFMRDAAGIVWPENNDP